MIELKEIGEDSIKAKLALKKLQGMDTLQLEQYVVNAIAAAPDADFRPETMSDGKISASDRADATKNGWLTVQVPYVNDREFPGQESSGINTSKRLHAVLGRLQTELREAGHTCTQAMGVAGSHGGGDRDRYETGKIGISFSSKNDPKPTPSRAPGMG